ncbi:MAG: HipA domain-containing protein [Myxococcota bacterium]
MTVRLRVLLHGQPVGTLKHRSDEGDACVFEFDEAYLDAPDRPVLGQWFEEDPRRERRTTHRVPPWFSNLLPEGPLRALLADRAGVNPERELHLLAALGEDLPGAVTTVQARDEALEGAPLRPAVGHDEPLRFSLAGMQLKFPVDPAERGMTVPLRGRGGRWIAKLPDARYPRVPENEAAMLSWARRAGVAVPDHELVPTSSIDNLPREGREVEGAALVVRRFDRPDSGAVHIEDFAQVLGLFPHEKYGATNFETLARVVHSLDPTGEDLAEFVRRLVFCVVTGNADAHVKNWSVWYPDRRAARLAPAYDLVCTVAYPGVDDKLALKLCRTRRFDEIDVACFRRLARKAGADEALVERVVRDTAARTRETADEALAELHPEGASRLREHLGRVRL